MSLDHDLITLDSLLTDEERALRDSVRSFVDAAIKPNIADWYEEAVFPLEIVPEMAKLGLLGMHLKGYGCAGRSAVDYGLAAAELEAGDSGLRTFVSVQGSLAMSAIHKHGSEEQKQQWLPQMATGEAIGCFGLTEPTAGSDPGSHEDLRPPRRGRLGAQRLQALDRPGLGGQGRHHLGPDR